MRSKRLVSGKGTFGPRRRWEGGENLGVGRGQWKSLQRDSKETWLSDPGSDSRFWKWILSLRFLTYKIASVDNFMSSSFQHLRFYWFPIVPTHDQESSFWFSFQVPGLC